jgi:hypothetical protein
MAGIGFVTLLFWPVTTPLFIPEKEYPLDIACNVIP